MRLLDLLERLSDEQRKNGSDENHSGSSTEAVP